MIPHDSLDDQRNVGDQYHHVVESQTTSPTIVPAVTNRTALVKSDFLAGQRSPGDQAILAGEDQITLSTRPITTTTNALTSTGSDFLSDQGCHGNHNSSVTEEQATVSISGPSETKDATSARSNVSHDQPTYGNHLSRVVGEQAPAETISDQAETILPPESLLDPTIALLAETLNDLEATRIAAVNRLNQLTRNEPDKDGKMRGFGLSAYDPDGAAFLTALIEGEDGLKAFETRATKQLERCMKGHWLEPWVKCSRGIGYKQVARLLATLGDPYVRPELHHQDGTVEPRRYRTRSELQAYCGVHVLPVNQAAVGDNTSLVDGNQADGDLNHGSDDNGNLVGVAASRRKGQRITWNPDARMRLILIAESCVKQRDATCKPTNEDEPTVHVDGCSCSVYRKVYDEGRVKYANAVHQTPCYRCGPKGSPAQTGSPLSKAHQHGRARRLIAREILKDIYVEARRAHGHEE